MRKDPCLPWLMTSSQHLPEEGVTESPIEDVTGALKSKLAEGPVIWAAEQGLLRDSPSWHRLLRMAGANSPHPEPQVPQSPMMGSLQQWE